MTVEELIERLREMPATAIVWAPSEVEPEDCVLEIDGAVYERGAVELRLGRAWVKDSEAAKRRAFLSGKRRSAGFTE